MCPNSHAPEAKAQKSLAGIVEDLAHLLPAQGPISIFIHHNTLHAFEHLRFEEAVERAGKQLGCEPFLAESRYREKLASGRILIRDVEMLLHEQLGEKATGMVAGAVSRFDLWRALVLRAIPEARGAELSWILKETPALSSFRTDLHASIRSALVKQRKGAHPVDERTAVSRLWSACLDAVRRSDPTVFVPIAAPIRHRDFIHTVHGLDTDAYVHPPLIRFLAGYLDQGLAHWSMPGRSSGNHGCFLGIYRTALAAHCDASMRALPRIVSDDYDAKHDALASIEHSLAELGVPAAEWFDYLTAELLALKGWAGIVRQIEERPDRVPVRDLTVTLRGYLAVRLLFERAALEHASRVLSFDLPLSELRETLRSRLPHPPPPTVAERAWPLSHVAQLCGLDSSFVEQWTVSNAAELQAEMRELDGIRCRRLLHLAFERTVRHRVYDALTQHTARNPPVPSAFQAVFCIDEREESFRRHLEEVEPACETLGTAGFFNVAMYHQGASDAHPRPLCPAAIRPEHYVAETDLDGDRLTARSRRLQRRAAGFLGYNVHLGSRLPVRGAVLMAAFGWLALIPLILRVLFPRASSRWRRAREQATTATRTRLELNRQQTPPPIGSYSGFTTREMANIVRRVLDDTGISERLAPLVLILGHGSISLNNPHESAHDCGACGGGRGGPNARAFAQMANNPQVQELLAALGLPLANSWFVGGQRNSCSNEVTFYDEDLVLPSHRNLFDRARNAIDEARRREARERCRRFDSAPQSCSPEEALAHVEGRAADLAQPRPEYGHATNAFCIIGRRSRTRGLFLDRRAFLASYEPNKDHDSLVLSRIMAAVVPVVAGISLEYYFSYVDPTGYGCGTKLPHNVTSLLGVMDGGQSDLRAGLPWQMVEIHEPARLAIIVETTLDRLQQALDHNPAIGRLALNRWFFLACLDPDSGTLCELRSTGFVQHVARETLPVVTGGSAAWYQGKRGFVAPAALAPQESAGYCVGGGA